MICRKCGATNALRRENRAGFFQLKVFPLFGLYPWECAMCRKVAMYQSRGKDKWKPQQRDSRANGNA